MIILGIDPGSAVTGYGFVDYTDRAYRFAECGCIRTEADLPFHRRLETIYDGILDLVAGHRPDVAAIEGIFLNRDVRGALKIGEVRGVITLAVVKSGLPVAEYSPAEVKKAVVGTGAASKQQVQFMIRHLLGLAELPRPHDAADALAVALCHAHRTGVLGASTLPPRAAGKKVGNAFLEKLMGATT